MRRERSALATLLLVASALSALPLLAIAQQSGPPLTPEQMQQQMMQRGYGPGYGGMGPGMMGGGYGPGYGMGPGMMGGGYGMGPGMMGGGYGPGYGMGPGMMGGGYGNGYGMGPLHALNLSDSQRDKIEKIRDTELKKHWEIGGKILNQQIKLRDLYQSEHQDPKKIGAVYGDIAKLQQQMLEIHVRADNEVRQALTEQQREQLKEWQRGEWGQRGGYGPGNGMGPGMMDGGNGAGMGPGMMRR